MVLKNNIVFTATRLEPRLSRLPATQLRWLELLLRQKSPEQVRSSIRTSRRAGGKNPRDTGILYLCRRESVGVVLLRVQGPHR